MEGQYIPEGALGKVWRVLDRCIMFTTVVGSLASVMFIGAMFLNVIMRYVFSSPIWWFDEMIIALLVWYSALGTVVCYWTNEHAVIHFFLKFINRTGKLFFMFIPHVVVAIGRFNSFRQLNEVITTARIYQPDQERYRQYERYYKLYCELYNQTKNMMHRIGEVENVP